VKRHISAKGKWTGGMPLLGYDVEQPGSRLVINKTEAAQVRQIFELYVEHRTLLSVVKILTDRGWCNKRWTTRKDTQRGGLPFTKTSLHKLLTNPTYLGKVKYKQELHDGEHQAIIKPDVWQQVQTLLSQNGRNGGTAVRNQFGALLKGLLRCSCCDTAMVPSITMKGDRRYRYYVCSSAQKLGWHTCPSKSVPAGEMEKSVVSQIRSLGADPGFVDTVLEQIGGVATDELDGQATQPGIPIFARFLTLPHSKSLLRRTTKTHGPRHVIWSGVNNAPPQLRCILSFCSCVKCSGRDRTRFQSARADLAHPI
jgi:hypothetical protein